MHYRFFGDQLRNHSSQGFVLLLSRLLASLERCRRLISSSCLHLISHLICRRRRRRRRPRRRRRRRHICRGCAQIVIMTAAAAETTQRCSPTPRSTEKCRFMGKEVREKRRAFVVLPRVFAPAPSRVSTDQSVAC